MLKKFDVIYHIRIESSPVRKTRSTSQDEKHSNEDVSLRRSVLILGDRSYARLLLIIVAELLILLVLVVYGLYVGLLVRASLTIVGATLTLVLRLL